MTAALAWRAIPLTIFCAGYGNVVMEVLRRGSPKITGPGGVFTPHLRLVANFFRVSVLFCIVLWAALQPVPSIVCSCMPTRNHVLYAHALRCVVTSPFPLHVRIKCPSSCMHRPFI